MNVQYCVISLKLMNLYWALEPNYRDSELGLSIIAQLLVAMKIFSSLGLCSVWLQFQLRYYEICSKCTIWSVLRKLNPIFVCSHVMCSRRGIKGRIYFIVSVSKGFSSLFLFGKKWNYFFFIVYLCDKFLFE